MEQVEQWQQETERRLSILCCKGVWVFNHRSKPKIYRLAPTRTVDI
ncbi:MAG TPA: hypothetical protein V6C91_01545 [Coleofasciculaceae cyanobacterium]